MNNYKNLLSPIKINGLTLKNRMLSAPTSLAELGPGEHYSPANIAYYKYKASGGCSLVTVGDVMAEISTGRSHPQQVGLDDPTAIPYLAELADAIHSGGAAASIEIDHGGALCSPEFLGGKNAIGPSGYVDDWGDTVEEMSEEEIYRIAEKFGEAAATAKDCGYDMVMLHAGHGWLLHQFISEITNHRTDKWGGSFENRMRFPLLVVEKIRAAVGPRFPIDVRISGSERLEGGYGIETGIKIAMALDGKVDLIHVSAGTQQDEYSAVLMHPGVFQEHGENSGLAREIKKHVKTPVCTVGAFSEPLKMEQFLEEGGADCIAMGRALLADPYMPKKLMRGHPEAVRPCLRCGECQSGMMKNGVLRCTVNPIIGKEQEFFSPIPVMMKRNVLIAGGGPAGMEAALAASSRGHSVILCEKNPVLGGALKYADGADFKRNMLLYRESQIRKVMSLKNVKVNLNTEVTPELVKRINPDVLILAIGADPIVLPVPGADGPNVVIGADLMPDTPLGNKIVVIGGGLVGSEIALHLAREGHPTAILEMRDEIAADCSRMHKINLVHQLNTCENLQQITGYACTAISKTAVTAKNSEGETIELPADTVIMAAGLRPRGALVDSLRGLVPETYVVGDCFAARNVKAATREAFDAVVNMGL